jgi:hypothetical protein
MSIAYSCNKKLFRAAARALDTPVPIDITLYYSDEEVRSLIDTHADWFDEGEWNVDYKWKSLWFIPHLDLPWFIPCCAWCYEERAEYGEENEHDLCDVRLYYHTEEGKAEQARLLQREIMPKAPASVIGLIMSFL